jgi:transposase
MRPKREFPEEYRRRIVELVRGGRTAESLSREFEPSANCIRTWVAEADAADGKSDGPISAKDRAELVRLRRENAQLREEKEILKKAAAWFAKEMDSKPKRDSSS